MSTIHLKLPILSAVIFLPLLGALAISFIPRQYERAIRITAVVFATVTLLISLPLFFSFDATYPNFQFEHQIEWIPMLRATYHVGLDGISLPLVMLTVVLMPSVLLASWRFGHSDLKWLLAALLLLECALLGTFAALDLLLFCMCAQTALIPMYFIVGIWGEAPQPRIAGWFLGYNLAAGLMVLVGVLYLYDYFARVTGTPTFDYLQIRELVIPRSHQTPLFLVFGIAFAINAAILPSHMWLTATGVAAPPGGAAVITAILIKVGLYGIIRIVLPLFPNAATPWMPLIGVFAILSLLYSAWAVKQELSLKRIIACLSVGHLGLVILGLFVLHPDGITGGIMHLVNHGLWCGALFLLVGMLAMREQTRNVADLGRLARRIPIFATLFSMTLLAAIGMPGLNGFVGQFLILRGVFGTKQIFAELAIIALLMLAILLVRTGQRVLFGRADRDDNHIITDLAVPEIVAISPLLGLILLLGVWPQPLLSRMSTSAELLIKTVTAKVAQIQNAPTLVPFIEVLEHDEPTSPLQPADSTTSKGDQ